MAVFCSRCGTQNADGVTNCVRCGTPLVTFAAGPPPGALVPQQPVAPLPQQPYPVAPVPQQAYPAAPYVPQPYVPGQSMYLPAPAGGNAPHRTSTNVVIAVIVVVIVVIAGAAVAFAALHVGGSTPTSHPGPPIPTLQPTPVPTSVPTSPPTSGPTPAGPGTGATQDFAFATVFVPAGWNILGQGSDYVAMGPSDHSGEVIVQSDPAPSGVTTNSQLDQALLQTDQRNDPSARFCRSASSVPLNGTGGQITGDGTFICMNYTPQNGAAFMAIDAYAAAVAHSSSGLRAIFINVFARASDFDTFAASVPMEVGTQTVFKDAGP
jgi:hypothetical protein